MHGASLSMRPGCLGLDAQKFSFAKISIYVYGMCLHHNDIIPTALFAFLTYLRKYAQYENVFYHAEINCQ